MKYTIYQPINSQFRVNENASYKRNEFNFIYSGEIDEQEDKIEILEILFEKFNTNRPDDFKGHSLSVGDVIGLDDEYYLCKAFGWRKLDEFIQ